MAGREHSNPTARGFLEVLRQGGEKDARTQKLLARLAELEDFEFFQAEQKSNSLLDAESPQVLRIHACANEAVQRAYASFVLYRIYQDMFQRGRPDRITHAVIFDEAHRAAKLKLIPTMAKECRKYGVAMILASQEARDFDDGLYAAVANYLILRVTDQDARALSRNIAPADSERRIADRLKALKRYQALFLSEQHRQPLHLTLGPPSDVQCRGIGRLAFPGVVCRHKGRVDAWQRNQLAKQLDNPAHVRRVLLPPDARNNSSR